MQPPPQLPAALPVGFRFRPTDEELVLHYLKPKIAGRAHADLLLIPDVDLSACEPWELPAKALIRSDDPEWFFFAPLDRKYPGGHRSNRSTAAGYWKATGKDRPISVSGRRGGGGVGDAAALVGMRKTLVFYQGRAPRGSKTEWVMHEFRVDGGPPVADRPGSPLLQLQEDWVLCRVFYKSRTASTRPAAGPDEAGPLSSQLIGGLPIPRMAAPADAAYLSFDVTPAAGGYYHHQGSGPADARHHLLPPPAQPFGRSSLSSLRDLLSSMVEGSDAAAAVRETELHLQLEGWTEAAYAQQQGGAMPAHPQQTWSPFLSSG